MSNPQLLWADDEIDLLKPHIMFLQQKGYDVTTVTNGQDALDQVRQKTFDLVFLDPPYGSGLLEKSLEQITAIDIVTENGIIVCENGSNAGWPTVSLPYRLQKEYRYGKIKTAVYRRLADDSVPPAEERTTMP